MFKSTLGGTTTAAGEAGPANGPSDNTGNQRNQRNGGRKKEEWVQYELPNNCKGLLAQDKVTASSPVNGTSGDGVSDKKDSLLVFLDSGKKDKTGGSGDWPLDSAAAGGDRFSSAESASLTGVKLDVRCDSG